IFVSDQLLYRYGRVFSVQRSNVFIEGLNLSFPLVFRRPAYLFAIHFNGQDAFEVTQTVYAQIGNSEYDGAPEHQYPPARQRVIQFLNTVVIMTSGLVRFLFTLAAAGVLDQ